MTDNQQEYKFCPFCNERIKAEAIVCKYCKKNVPNNNTLTEKNEVKKAENKNKHNNFNCFIIILIVSAIVGGLFNLLPCLGNIAIPIIAFIAVIIHNLIIKEMNNRLLNSMGMGVFIGIISTVLSTIICAILLSIGNTDSITPPSDTNITPESMEAIKNTTRASMLGLGAVFGVLINTILSLISSLIAAALINLIKNK